MGENGGLRTACIGVIVIVLLGFPGEIYGGVRLGPLSFTPYVNVSGTFTDNVFLTKSDKKSDFYYSFLPGLKVRATPIGRHHFYLDYDADISQFNEYTGADYVVQSLDAGLELDLPKKFRIRLGDKITYGADLPDAEGDETSQYIDNLARIELSHTFFDRFGIGLRYSHEFKDYERSRDEIDNFDTNTVGGVFRFRILRRTSMLVEYVYSVTDYRRDVRARVENNYSNRINTGITWDITAKTRGTVKGGYIQTTHHRIDREDDSTFASANISHELTSHITISVTGIRSIFDTSNADDNIQFSTSYVSSQVTGKLQHTYRKFTTSIGGDYIHDRYLHDDLNVGRKREDDVWRGWVGVDYHMQRWIKLGLKYRYTNLDSNFDTEGYDENLLAFLVGLTL
jgi:hypothetical protein